MGGNAKCQLCGEYKELTTFQQERIRKILKVCPDCKKWIKKYEKVLISENYF